MERPDATLPRAKATLPSNLLETHELLKYVISVTNLSLSDNLRKLLMGFWEAPSGFLSDAQIASYVVEKIAGKDAGHSRAEQPVSRLRKALRPIKDDVDFLPRDSDRKGYILNRGSLQKELAEHFPAIGLLRDERRLFDVWKDRRGGELILDGIHLHSYLKKRFQLFSEHLRLGGRLTLFIDLRTWEKGLEQGLKLLGRHKATSQITLVVERRLCELLVRAFKEDAGRLYLYTERRPQPGSRGSDPQSRLILNLMITQNTAVVLEDYRSYELLPPERWIGRVAIGAGIQEDQIPILKGKIAAMMAIVPDDPTPIPPGRASGFGILLDEELC